MSRIHPAGGGHMQFNDSRDIQNGTKGSNRRHHLKIKTGITALVLAGVLAFGGCAANAGASSSDTALQSTGSAEGVSTSGTSGTESKSANTVSIKDDYYAAVNAGVLKTHGGDSGDETWNWFYDIIDKTEKEEAKIIKSAASDVKGSTAQGSSSGKDTEQNKDSNSSASRLGALYNLAVDSAGRKEDGVKYFNEIMQPVMEAKSVQELMNELAKLQYKYGFTTLLNTEVLATDDDPGNNSAVLDSMYYFLDQQDFKDGKEDKNTESDNRSYFTDYMQTALKEAGYSDSDAKKQSEEVYSFVKDIAGSEGTRNTSYDHTSIADLQKIMSNVNLKEYFSNIYKKDPTELRTMETASLEKLNSYLTEDHLEMLKAYAYMMNLSKCSEYLSEDIVQALKQVEDNHIGEDDEKKDPEKTTVTQVSSLLDWDLGKIYAEKHYDSRTKAAVAKLTDRIISEYKSMIRDEAWLSDAAKEKALKKLEKMNIRIGVPDNIEEYLSKWTPVSREEGGSYLSNVLAIREEKSEKSYDSFGQKADRTHWNLTPQDMNPCYYPTDNSINIPVAALQKPYFSVRQSKEQNLGALGTIIGHEITHAFDDLGSQYDENGDYVNWWSDADKKAFNERAEKIVTYYTNYKTPGIMQQDGQQTLGENIADLGSMHCLTRIVKEDKMDAKAFFESYANSWASTSNAITEALTSGMDEHAADKVRVNAVLSSNDLFYQTYHISKGDGMYIDEGSRVELW